MDHKKNYTASDDANGGGEPIDTPPIRSTIGLVDPLLERLKQVHGERGKSNHSA
jgi:hypothetical protein